MTKRVNWIIRRTAPLLGAATLLQAGGCSTDLNNLAAGLVTSIANSLLSSLVLGVFNVGGI